MLFSRAYALCALAFALPAFPAVAEELGLVTGPKTGTYYAFGKELAQAAAKRGIVIDVKPSEGSIDNIRRINSRENAGLGFVQSDVLGFLSRSKNPDSMRMASNLRLVFPLYDAEVHVLARRDVASLADLAGKKVAIGEEGSGTMLTAINLLAMLDVKPQEMLKIDAAKGLAAVLKGEADAVVFVGGKPVRLFKNLEDLALPGNEKFAPMLAAVHFLELDNPKLLEEYKPATLAAADYGFIGGEIRTVATQAVLISYDFSRGDKKRCELLASLAKTLRDALPELKEKGHPKWKEADFDASPGLWKKDGCAWPELSGGTEDSLGDDLIGVIEEKKN